jgi:alkylhydroperoxidase family enzyme
MREAGEGVTKYIAIVTKFRTDQRHPRENGNPWVALPSRWIPACAGMTEKRLIELIMAIAMINFAKGIA